ncbi:MAG TPA: DNA repair protein RecO [Gammaproteobacteria bacterium]|nr:DNA repair protein RecO [Gammaproteobacteria bacterium]
MGERVRHELVPGFVLHRRPYRETSALLEVFTASQGRVGLVARGVQGGRPRRRAELQAFRPLRLSWQARGELGTLSGVEAGGAALTLTGAALYSGFYLNELLLRLLQRNDPQPVLFARYHDTLNRLCAPAPELERALRLFEKTLLQEAGYGLPLEADALSGDPVDPQGLYEYRLEQGPVRVDAGRREGLLISGASLLALHRGELVGEALRDARRLMRAALDLYLGGKPLKSRELFRRVGGR